MTASHAFSAGQLQAGPLLDETVCSLLGIKPWPVYVAALSYGTRKPWLVSDHQSDVDRAIAEANERRSDGIAELRAGSTLHEVKCYPSVSGYDSSAAQCLDALVARGGKLSIASAAAGLWVCHLALNVGKNNERQYHEYGSTRPLAICAVVLAAAEALKS